MLQTAAKISLYPLATIGNTRSIHTINQITNSISATPATTSLSFFNRRFCSASALADDDILERIKKVFGEMERAKLDDSKPLTAESHIFNDVGLDSLDFVEFGIALEDEFGIEIEDEKAEGIVTVGDAIQLIKESPNAA